MIRFLMTFTPDKIIIVNTSFVPGYEIDESISLACTFSLGWFIWRKYGITEKAYDQALRDMQNQAFRDGAHAVINLKTTFEMQNPAPLYTRVNVYMEGTGVTLVGYGD